MKRSLNGLPIGLAGLALLAPSAQAADKVVANPGPGVTAVSLSDVTEPGKIVVRATTPIASDHFSAMFFDIDGDGDADRAIHASKTGGAGSIRANVTPHSSTDCQQFGGDTVLAITGAVVSFNGDNSGWKVTIPGSFLPGNFRWKLTAAAPAGDELCGGTDNQVHGLAFGLSDAHTFTSGATAPPLDTTPPAAPAGLTATAGNTTAVVDWADNAESDVAGYLVYRRVQGGSFTLVAEPAASRLDDAGLVNGTTYEYYLRASDAAGNLSPESARITVTPTAPVSPPVTDERPAPVPPRPANTKTLVSVGNADLLKSTKAADQPRFNPANRTVVVGLLYNAEAVPSRVAVKFTVRVPIGKRGRSAKFKTVVVGTSKLQLEPGESLPLKFKLNAAGRKLSKARKALKLTAALTVKPEGMKASKGSVKVTVKKAKKPRRQKAAA